MCFIQAILVTTAAVTHTNRLYKGVGTTRLPTSQRLGSEAAAPAGAAVADLWVVQEGLLVVDTAPSRAALPFAVVETLVPRLLQRQQPGVDLPADAGVCEPPRPVPKLHPERQREGGRGGGGGGRDMVNFPQHEGIVSSYCSSVRVYTGVHT